MSDTVSKTDNFLKAIEKYAEQQRSQIESEAEDFKEKELDKAEEEGLREAYDLIQKKMANINISIAGELSRAENASKKKIFMRRQEIEQEVFEQAEKKLVEYTQSAKYLERLQKSAKDISDVLTADDVVLYVKAQDMKYADKIRSAFKGKCKVEASDEIRIGGLTGISKSMGLLADETLDSRLEQQRDWFCENSGLRVSG